MTVKDLLQRIDSRELTEWMAFFELEPWGCRKEDYRFAMLAAIFANAFRGKGKAALNPDDFIPKEPSMEQQSLEEMKTVLMAIAGKKGKKPKDG